MKFPNSFAGEGVRGGRGRGERGERRRRSLKQKLHPHNDLPEGKIQPFFLFSGKEEVGSSHYFLASQKNDRETVANETPALPTQKETQIMSEQLAFSHFD